jgi:hypothetical protein
MKADSDFVKMNEPGPDANLDHEAIERLRWQAQRLRRFLELNLLLESSEETRPDTSQ